MDAFLAECTKTLFVDNVPAFKKGTFYQWGWSEDVGNYDGPCEYCFKSEISDKHFMTQNDVEEFFAQQTNTADR